MKLVELPTGIYINLDRMTYIEDDYVSLLVHFASKDKGFAVYNEDRKTLLKALGTFKISLVSLDGL